MYELTSVSDHEEHGDLLGKRANLHFYSDGIGFGTDLLMKPKRKVEKDNTITVYTQLGNKFVFKKVS